MRRVLSPLTWGFIFCIVCMWLFDASVTWGQKPRGQDIDSRTSDQHWISYLRTLKDTHNPEFPCLHGKPSQHSSQHSVQENPQLFSRKRNTTVNVIKGGAWSQSKPKNTPKHNPWTIHCTSERRDIDLPATAQTQIPQSIKPWQVTGSIPPTKDSFHNAVEP